MDKVRLESKDTNVRVDQRDPPRDVVDLVLHTREGVVVVSGTSDSVLMLVDRINDRVSHLRGSWP